MAANSLTASSGEAKAAAMTSRISHISFDAADAYAQSLFWSKVLDFTEDPDDPNEPGHQECLITSRDRSQLLLFITIPDGKQVKNRVHLDLRPADCAALTAAAGSLWPTLRATSSASCPKIPPAPA
jgi:hypothetical protein